MTPSNLGLTVALKGRSNGQCVRKSSSVRITPQDPPRPYFLHHTSEHTHNYSLSTTPQDPPTILPYHASGPAYILPCQSSQHPPTTSLSITPQYTTTVLPRQSPLSARPQPFPSNHASGLVHGLPLSITPQDQPTAFPCQSRSRTRPWLASSSTATALGHDGQAIEDAARRTE